MLKVMPINFYNQKSRKPYPSFSSGQNNASALPQKTSLSVIRPLDFPWVKDEKLLSAISRLNHVKFDNNDVKYIQSLGIVLPFQSGEEAVSYIKNSHIGVKFEKLSSVNTHARYDFEDNCIEINEIYRNTQNPAEMMAISEAILHEAGHAKDRDNSSSLQEEIECLSLNALSHRFFCKNSYNVFSNANALIVKDGVCVYADLFFDNDPSKAKLINRLKQKYGELPAGDFRHSPCSLALRVKSA